MPRKASGKRRAPKTQVLAETVRRLATEARKAQHAFERATLLRAHQQEELARKVAARKPAKAAPKTRKRRSIVPDEIPFNF